MRVQVIYGEHAEADFACRACHGTGEGSTLPGGRCWVCMGRGSTALDQRTYTYDAPDGTKLWDVLITPTPAQSGKRGTVVSLSSAYDGPVKQAYPLPTFPCKGNCGTVLTRADPRYFCRDCWALVPEAMRRNLDEAPGFRALPVVRAISDYLRVAS